MNKSAQCHQQEFNPVINRTSTANSQQNAPLTVKGKKYPQCSSYIRKITTTASIADKSKHPLYERQVSAPDKGGVTTALKCLSTVEPVHHVREVLPRDALITSWDWEQYSIEAGNMEDGNKACTSSPAESGPFLSTWDWMRDFVKPVRRGSLAVSISSESSTDSWVLVDKRPAPSESDRAKASAGR